MNATILKVAAVYVAAAVILAIMFGRFFKFLSEQDLAGEIGGALKQIKDSIG